MRLPRILTTIICLAITVSIDGQAQKLNNDSILKMKAAGLGDQTIITAIETSAGNYDTSVAGLIALKAGGASDAILTAILNHAKTPAPPAQSTKALNGYPDELGLYYLQQNTYVALEPEIMNVRSTNVLATMYSFEAKALKINGWIAGKHSKNCLYSGTRTFLLNIPEGVSPTEYTLLKFHAKGDRREVELGRSRFSARMGIPEKSTVHFESKKIDKGKYKITVTGLRLGEYGFMPPGAEISRNSTSVGKIYSFQVIE